MSVLARLRHLLLGITDATGPGGSNTICGGLMKTAIMARASHLLIFKRCIPKPNTHTGYSILSLDAQIWKVLGYMVPIPGRQSSGLETHIRGPERYLPFPNQNQR